jgi:hypothetical protein
VGSIGNRADDAEPVVGEAECDRDCGAGCKAGFAGEGHWIRDGRFVDG